MAGTHDHPSPDIGPDLFDLNASTHLASRPYLEDEPSNWFTFSLQHQTEVDGDSSSPSTDSDHATAQAGHDDPAHREKRDLSPKRHTDKDQSRLSVPRRRASKRRWPCAIKPCPRAKSKDHAPTFASRAERRRHYNEFHNFTSDEERLEGFYCPSLGCRSQKPFTCHGDLIGHLRKVHENDSVRVPKSQCKEDESPGIPLSGKIPHEEWYWCPDRGWIAKSTKTSELVHMDGVEKTEDLQSNYKEEAFVPKKNAALQCPICAYEDPRQQPFELKSKFIEHVLVKHQVQSSHIWLGTKSPAEGSTAAQAQCVADSIPTEKHSAGVGLPVPELKSAQGSPSSSYSSTTRLNLSGSPPDEISTTSSPASEISDLTVTTDLNVYARSFVAALARRIVRRCIAFDERMFLGCTGNREQHGDSTTYQISGGRSTTSQSGSRKRARPKDNEDVGDGGDENDNGNNAGNPSKRPCHPVPTSKRFWACPHTKFDSLRYSEHNQNEKQYRKCPSAMLSDLAKLKQHLRRTHQEPKYFCGNCFESFAKKPALLQHNKTVCAASTPKYEEMMTEEQSLLIHNYLPNNSASWYRIYRILFGDVPQPASPYVTISDTSQIQQFIGLFQVIGPAEFLGTLSAGLDRNPQSLQINVPLRVLIEETFETAFPEYLDMLGAVVSGGTTQSFTAAPGGLPPPADFNFDNQDASLTAGNQEVGSQDFDFNSYNEALNWRSQPAMIGQAFRSYANDRFNELGLSGGMSLPENPSTGQHNGNQGF